MQHDYYKKGKEQKFLAARKAYATYRKTSKPRAHEVLNQVFDNYTKELAKNPRQVGGTAPHAV